MWPAPKLEVHSSSNAHHILNDSCSIYHEHCFPLEPITKCRFLLFSNLSQWNVASTIHCYTCSSFLGIYSSLKSKQYCHTNSVTSSFLTRTMYISNSNGNFWTIQFVEFIFYSQAFIMVVENGIHNHHSPPRQLCTPI